MKEGDFIVGIGDKDVKWAPHEEVVALIKASGNNLNLRIVTPVDKRHTAIGKVTFDTSYYYSSYYDILTSLCHTFRVESFVPL